MINKELLVQITNKKEKIEQLRVVLKNKFFGIDNEIDKIIDSIKTWYILPEIITSPLIINLWSLTGNGKTDLVRTIADFLNFNNKFCEIQLSDSVNINDGKSISKINDLILKSGCREREAGIILLDEFQRYRTINLDGRDVQNLPYQDVWMLLSDGRLPVANNKDAFYKAIYSKLAFEWKSVEIDNSGEIKSEISDDEYDYYLINNRKLKGKKDKVNIDYVMIPRTREKYFTAGDIFLIEQIRSLTDYIYTDSEIASWSFSECLNKIKDYKDNLSPTYDYTKYLIFVAGNLDEAFKVANNSEDCDTDADIFHEYTKKVSIIEIKKALSSRFKPEQVSRLGNNHIIYPSLNKESYIKIIRRTCSKYLESASKISGINFSLDPSVIMQIYENSVYPTQGTRPVFSSIHMMFSSPLSNGILWALENGVKNVRAKINPDASCISFVSEDVKDLEICTPIQFEVRDRKSRYSNNFSAMVAVHEMGHAIAYSYLFKSIPKEIKINVASFTGGYNKYNQSYLCSKEILNKICVAFGGIAAEELIFGKEYRSTGSESDIEFATELASSYTRRYSMTENIGTVKKNNENSFITNDDVSNSEISAILREQKEKAFDIMKNHKDFLIKSSKYLLERKSFSKEEFHTYSKDVFDYSNDEDLVKIDTSTKYYEILISQ